MRVRTGEVSLQPPRLTLFVYDNTTPLPLQGRTHFSFPPPERSGGMVSTGGPSRTDGDACRDQKASLERLQHTPLINANSLYKYPGVGIISSPSQMRSRGVFYSALARSVRKTMSLKPGEVPLQPPCPIPFTRLRQTPAASTPRTNYCVPARNTSGDINRFSAVVMPLGMGAVSPECL